MPSVLFAEASYNNTTPNSAGQKDEELKQLVAQHLLPVHARKPADTAVALMDVCTVVYIVKTFFSPYYFERNTFTLCNKRIF